MNADSSDGRNEPLTAEWLKANTRIHGWLSFFIFAIGVGGLISLVYPFATYNASDYAGSYLLGMTDLASGVVMAVVAGWSIVSLCRRSPAAIFWSKLYTVLVLLTNVLVLCIGETQDVKGFGGLNMTVKSVVWAIIWFCYLTFSSQVREVIPISYRRTGALTWICAVLLLLVPLAFVVVGSVDAAVNYHNNVEISQSELSDGELTDGHVVFSRLDGWSFGMERSEGINFCLFKKGDEQGITLFSALDSDDSKDYFVRTAEGSECADFKGLVHRTVCDDSSSVNGHTCHYRIVQYDLDDGVSFFWHFACLFDQESGKAVSVSGYFPDRYALAFAELLRSVRFKKR